MSLPLLKTLFCSGVEITHSLYFSNQRFEKMRILYVKSLIWCGRSQTSDHAYIPSSDEWDVSVFSDPDEYGRTTVLVLFYFCSQFNTVDQDISLKLMESWVGLSGTTLHCFVSYIKNRDFSSELRNVWNPRVPSLVPSYWTSTSSQQLRLWQVIKLFTIVMQMIHRSKMSPGDYEPIQLLSRSFE